MRCETVGVVATLSRVTVASRFDWLIRGLAAPWVRRYSSTLVLVVGLGVTADEKRRRLRDLPVYVGVSGVLWCDLLEVCPRRRAS